MKKYENQKIKKEEKTIEIKYPWTMVPLEAFDKIIYEFKEQICEGHPLHGKKFFPNLRHFEKPIFVFDLDDENTHIVLDFSRSKKNKNKLIPDHSIEKDLEKIMEKFKQEK